MKKVTVLVPFFNSEEYLEECIQSILNQSLKEMEVICLDDGSTDRSAQIAEKYAKRDMRLRLIRKKNTGYGNTMNIGMEEAEGEYIAIVESDDWIKPMMLETLVKLADTYQLDMIKSDFCCFKNRPGGEDEVEPIHLCNNFKDYDQVFCPSEKLSSFFAPINTWSGIYRREFIKKYGIKHNETPGASYQDNGFWFQTFIYARRAMFHYEPFYMNRRDNMNSSVYSPNKVYAICEEYDFIDEIIQKMGTRGERFRGIYGYHRYMNYLSTLKRIADKYKQEFLIQFQQDYLKALKAGEVNESYFSAVIRNEIHSIIESPQDYYNRLNAWRTILEGAEEIIIYGAGNIGQQVYQMICDSKCNEKVKCFAVSYPCRPDSYARKPIICIDEISYHPKKTLIIVAVKKESRFNIEIKQKLHQLGYKNYIEMENGLI